MPLEGIQRVLMNLSFDIRNHAMKTLSDYPIFMKPGNKRHFNVFMFFTMTGFRHAESRKNFEID